MESQPDQLQGLACTEATESNLTARSIWKPDAGRLSADAPMDPRGQLLESQTAFPVGHSSITEEG